MFLRRKYRFIIFYILGSVQLTFCNELYPEEVRSLSELPLNKLIQLKTNLESENHALEDTELVPKMEGKMALPIALHLKRYDIPKMKSIKRQGFDEGESENKISKIFHLALTTLAFLAFGGYLLSLIIASARRTSSTSLPGNVIVLSSLQGVQGVQNVNKFLRPRLRRHVHIIDPAENDFDIDKAYRGMIMLSRGYASYNALN